MSMIYTYVFGNGAMENTICDEFSRIAIPADHDARSRNALLKNYIGKLQFCGFKNGYQIASIDVDGIPHEDEHSCISSAIDKLNIVRNHPVVTNIHERAALLKEAKKHMVNDTFGEIKDESTLVRMIYLLHRENWFDIFPLPDEAFEFEEHDNRMDMVGEVYGRYILFYDYLQEQLKTCCAIPAVLKQDMKKPCTQPTWTFEDLFMEARKKEGLYDKIIQTLSEPLPYHIANACGIKEEVQFVNLDGDKINWCADIRGSYSYLSGLYEVCREKNLIKKNSKLYLSSARNSFGIDMSRSAFEKMKSGTLDDKYIKPFRLLLKYIK